MRLFLPALLAAAPIGAAAEPLRVVTDIAPVHALVAMVAGDLLEPVLLLPPGTDPHHFAFRPSDAEALASADLVIWVGPGLTPWLEEPLATLAPDATRLTLLETDGWTPRLFADAEESHDHGDDHAEEGHDDHDDHAGHDHGPVDPHAWLDPAVAAVWAGHIAASLAQADPANAASYLARADGPVSADLQALDATVAATLAPVRDRPFLWPHDAYGYFGAHFGLTALGAVASSDADTPGPADLAAWQSAAAAGQVACVLADSVVPEQTAAVVAEGTPARIALINDTGIGLDPGPQLYAETLTALAATIAGCLKP